MNDFDRTQVENLKASIDLVEVFRQCGLAVEKAGQGYKCRCPFHEDGEASLRITPSEGLWNCFGCEAGGDHLSLLQRHQNLSFHQAVLRLREMQGQAPEPPKKPRKHSKRAPAELLGRVAELYHQRLRETSEALAYLEKRGLGARELVDGFRLGYCDGSLTEQLPITGQVREELVELGVLKPGGRELFRGCLVVPLEHPDQGVVGLYGRRLRADAKVRHLTLPGPRRGVLNWQALKGADEITLAEGVLDALSLWAAGVRNVTCLYGTQGLPEDLASLLGRFGVRRVRLCLDGDQAGRRAVTELGDQLTARGVATSAVALPEGADPNQVLCDQGPDALAALVRQAEPAAAPAEGPELEPLENGFLLKFGALSYEVTPRPPFVGQLRVMLRVRAPGFPPFLDKLDLCSHRSRALVTGQLARTLELSKDEIERHFLQLVQAVEGWAEDQAAAETSEEPGVRQAPEMTAEDRESALAFLRRPDLVATILEDMETMGYVGEREPKLLAYLIGLSRKLEKPLSGIILSQSGAGKSCLAETIESLTPPEDVEHYSRLSPQALAYLPETFLKHKLLIIEERVGAESSDYHIRVLQSKRRLTQAVVMKDPVTGRMRTCQFEVEGPIAYLETTTNRRLNHENATRCFEIELDESQEQTLRIQERQRLARTAKRLGQPRRTEEVAARHHNAQRLLEPVCVIIPYVEHLRFPSRWLRTRRDNERFLCLIEAVTFLHQHQREGGVDEDGVPYVLSTPADYRLAFELAREVLASTLHELGRDARALWTLARELAHTRAAEDRVDPTGVLFTRRELRQFSEWEDHRMRESLRELVEMEYLGVQEGGARGKTYRYHLASDEADGPLPLRELTTPDQLEALLS